MECRRTRTPLSNFISVRMKSQPKIRIKLPKLLVNTMQKIASHHHGDHNNKKCPRKVTLVFTNPFAKYKSPDKSSSKSNEASTNGSKLRPPKLRVPLLDFLTKNKSMKKLMRSKTDTTGVHDVGKQASSGHLVLSKPMLSNCRKLRMAMSFMRARKMKSEEKLEEDSKQDSSSEYELCKKRILMGGRCRSGSLHYDQNGILLSDVL